MMKLHGSLVTKLSSVTKILKASWEASVTKILKIFLAEEIQVNFSPTNFNVTKVINDATTHLDTKITFAKIIMANTKCRANLSFYFKALYIKNNYIEI